MLFLLNFTASKSLLISIIQPQASVYPNCRQLTTLAYLASVLIAINTMVIIQLPQLHSSLHSGNSSRFIQNDATNCITMSSWHFEGKIIFSLLRTTAPGCVLISALYANESPTPNISSLTKRAEGVWHWGAINSQENGGSVTNWNDNSAFWENCLYLLEIEIFLLLLHKERKLYFEFRIALILQI